jgi:hypothetical protein
VVTASVRDSSGIDGGHALTVTDVRGHTRRTRRGREIAHDGRRRYVRVTARAQALRERRQLGLEVGRRVTLPRGRLDRRTSITLRTRSEPLNRHRSQLPARRCPDTIGDMPGGPIVGSPTEMIALAGRLRQLAHHSRGVPPTGDLLAELATHGNARLGSGDGNDDDDDSGG